jgi:hypothetical protein
MTTNKQTTAIAKKQITLRNQLWPGTEDRLWHQKKEGHKGFVTIPKTMPMILKIMDRMSKGKPVSSTYLALWCSTWDNSFIVLSRPRDLAYAAGFGGQRGEYTWKARMRILEELGFIEVRPGRGGDFGYALILNPHLVIRKHRSDKTPGLLDADYAALIEIAQEVGAKDMTGEL